jgi:hypothetical protein
VLDLKGMDILLSMDWMTRHRVSLDISSWAVEIGSPYQGTTILYLSPRKCINSCAYAIEGIKLEDIPIICEYPDVFPEDLPRMPPDRDIEFIIELQPGTALFQRGHIVCHPMSSPNWKFNFKTSLIKGFIRTMGMSSPIREEKGQ